MSSAPVMTGLGGLFGNVSSAEAQEGSVRHRCVYLLNDDELPLLDARAWLHDPPSEPGNVLEIAIASAVGDAPRAREDDGPGLEFSAPVSRASGLACPSTIRPGEHVAVWLRRKIIAGARPGTDIRSTIAVEGDIIVSGRSS